MVLTPILDVILLGYFNVDGPVIHSIITNKGSRIAQTIYSLHSQEEQRRGALEPFQLLNVTIGCIHTQHAYMQ